MRRLLLLTLIAFLGVFSRADAQSYSESDWQMAFNAKVAHGKVEVQHPTGRIDILADEYAGVLGFPATPPTFRAATLLSSKPCASSILVR